MGGDYEKQQWAKPVCLMLTSSSLGQGPPDLRELGGEGLSLPGNGTLIGRWDPGADGEGKAVDLSPSFPP